MSFIESQQLIDDLQGKIHACLNPHLEGGYPVAILDFPDIKNCGDSAIWLGEMEYLRKNYGIRPSYVSRSKDFNAGAALRAVGDGTIFIHGGGNFGDIWLGHQRFRESVMKQLKGRKIVQFPQSIHFAKKENIEICKRAVGEHGSFVLLVRDVDSYEFAVNNFDCQVELCPDMAFCIGRVTSSAPTIPVLAMMRQDKEQVGESIQKHGFDFPIEDWITESAFDIKQRKISAYLSALGSLNRHEMKLAMLDAAANARFSRGISQISRADALVTDRLHVHICSILLDKPHAVLDNNYRKIEKFMNAFSGGTNLVHRPEGFGSAVEWAFEKSKAIRLVRKG